MNLRECMHLTADKNTYTSIMNSNGVNYIVLHNPEGFPYQTRNPLTSNHVMI